MLASFPVLAALLSACGGPASEGSPAVGPTGTPPRTDPVEAFRADAEAAGHALREGALVFATYEGCCDPGANCLGNNPATPYGTYALPRLPDEAPADDVFAPWGPVPEGLSRTVRLRPDEALVALGTVPPAVRYLGIQAYVVEHQPPTGEPVLALGSLGEPLHHLAIASARGVTPDALWGEPLVVVTTADRAVEDRMRALLVDAGVDPDHIHADRITTDAVTLGIDADTDTFSVVWRPALALDPSASEAFYAAPGTTVFRVTPTVERPLEQPHPRPDFPPPGSGSDESAWLEALAALEAAIDADLDGIAHVEVEPLDVYQDTLDCIPTGRCSADSRDRFVRTSPLFTLDGDTFLVAFGVNHARTGKASYSNLSVVEEEHLIGLTDLDSDAMVGSARHWLPDHPLVDDLYAVTVRRDCSDRPEACLEVPTGCPGADPGEAMRLTLRAYLEPATGVAPAADELAPDRMVKYFPSAPATASSP